MAKQTINIGSSENDPTAESIRSAFNKTNQMFTDLYPAIGHNVLAHGALGNTSHQTGGGNDDTAAIQSAIDAAAAAGGYGVVLFPTRRAYRITSSLVVPIGVHLVGLGGFDDAATGTPPTLVWTGSNGGTIVDVVCPSAVTNISNVQLHNLSFCGTLTGGGGTSAATAIKYRSQTPGNAARTDFGTFLSNVQFYSFNGDALRFEGRGATNFKMVGGRFDDIYGGYGVYVDLKYQDGSFIAVFEGNVNWVGGSHGQGKGFMFLDAEGMTSSDFPFSHVTFLGLHTEVNQDLTETYASGTNPYDKQGIIRLGCSPAAVAQQHQIFVHGWHNSNGSGLKSYSAFQLTSSSGTDDEVSDMVCVTLDSCHGLHATAVNDAGALNEQRLFGGKVPASRRPPYTIMTYIQRLTWGQGRDFQATAARNWSHCRPGCNRDSRFGLVPTTVSALPSFVYGTSNGAGEFAVVTDSNSTTRGATVAGGGSNIVLVMYNGTNWIIV